MDKSQAVAFVLAGLVAGAGGSQILSSATKAGIEYNVQQIRSHPARLPDGGTQVQVETCGIVNKHDGNSAQRWCDYRPDKNMDALVAASVDRLAEAAAEGEKRQKDAQASLEKARAKQAADAEARRKARLAQPPAPAPVPGPTP